LIKIFLILLSPSQSILSKIILLIDCMILRLKNLLQKCAATDSLDY